MITFDTAKGAKPHALATLFPNYPEVSGLGIARVGDGWGFKVNLMRPPKRKLPTEIDGVPVVAEVVGEVTAH
jgi:hypothetical protein